MCHKRGGPHPRGPARSNMDPKATIRALVYRPGEPAALEEVEGFKGFHRLCGGQVERIVLDWGPKGGSRILQLWCNEDGISQGLPVNLYAEGPSYTGAPIFGTA